VPVLAGSAAYALGEAHKWRIGLARRPDTAKAFYSTIALATMIGALLNLSPINPIKALYWTAVINGTVAVPVMATMMLMTTNPSVMGRFTITGPLRVVGWGATLIMAVTVIGMGLTAIL
jgi:Mn2+/Fe2+ NRAMP family transporter